MAEGVEKREVEEVEEGKEEKRGTVSALMIQQHQRRSHRSRLLWGPASVLLRAFLLRALPPSARRHAGRHRRGAGIEAEGVIQ